MKTQIFESYSKFFEREDKTLNGVTREFAEANKLELAEDRGNIGCWNCSGCSGCSDCSDCSDCSGLAPQKLSFDVPVIPNIHQAVFKAVSAPKALDMLSWHTCETTHCRAGWVVRLAVKRVRN